VSLGRLVRIRPLEGHALPATGGRLVDELAEALDLGLRRLDPARERGVFVIGDLTGLLPARYIAYPSFCAAPSA
jgi:hypothetical protein